MSDRDFYRLIDLALALALAVLVITAFCVF